MKPRASERKEIEEALTDGRIQCRMCDTIVEERGAACEPCAQYERDCAEGLFDEPLDDWWDGEDDGQ